jgi:hypothetical protein
MNKMCIYCITLNIRCIQFLNEGKKAEVVPLLNEFKHYAMKAYGGVDV